MNSKLITTFNLTVSRHRIHHLNCSIFMCALQIVLHVYALNAGLCIALLSLEIVRRDFSRFHFQHEKSFNFCNRKHFQLYIPIVAFSRRTWAWAYNAQQMARWFYRSFAIFFSLPRSFFVKNRNCSEISMYFIVTSHHIQCISRLFQLIQELLPKNSQFENGKR